MAAMIRRRRIQLALVAILAIGIGWAVYKIGAPIHADLTAARALRPLLAEGRRLVPVRQHEHMRGDAKQDYHCFDDGQCFYAIETFRRLYPAYNDLEDDALLRVIRDQNGAP
jgi:hypothetical protein